MKSISIEINCLSDYEWIRLKLRESEIYPTNIGDWHTYRYLVFYPSTKELTNYTSAIGKGKDTYICKNLYTFVKTVKSELAKNLMAKEFTKTDLKSGMIVKTEGEDFYLVLEDTLIGVSGYMRLSSYNDNLVINNSTSHTIVEVYEKDHRTWGTGFNSSLSSNLTLIWKRQEVKEFTLQEIVQEFADKRGISVEQIRIKE